MAVKTRPHEEICDTLSWPHRASGILQSEAGTRAESEVNQMCHTAALREDDMGNSSECPEKVSDSKAAI
ncbi:MAG: hypothetical protein F6J98_23280 [Moorea sp. SIO4G2]|nr:hypothetical protein [Moorena sp. SIO4G2]